MACCRPCAACHSPRCASPNPAPARSSSCPFQCAEEEGGHGHGTPFLQAGMVAAEQGFACPAAMSGAGRLDVQQDPPQAGSPPQAAECKEEATAEGCAAAAAPLSAAEEVANVAKSPDEQPLSPRVLPTTVHGILQEVGGKKARKGAAPGGPVEPYGAGCQARRCHSLGAPPCSCPRRPHPHPHPHPPTVVLRLHQGCGQQVSQEEPSTGGAALGPGPGGGGVPGARAGDDTGGPGAGGAPVAAAAGSRLGRPPPPPLHLPPGGLLPPLRRCCSWGPAAAASDRSGRHALLLAEAAAGRGSCCCCCPATAWLRPAIGCTARQCGPLPAPPHALCPPHPSTTTPTLPHPSLSSPLAVSPSHRTWGCPPRSCAPCCAGPTPSICPPPWGSWRRRSRSGWARASLGPSLRSCSAQPQRSVGHGP